MKQFIITFSFLFSLTFHAQTVTGRWKTIDDETGKAKSIMEIYQQNGKIYGKVQRILTPGEENSKCTACTGNLKGKPIKGMIVLKDLTKDGEEWSGGTIMDPNNGKTYKCYLTLEEEDKLKVRGYIGFSLIGRTQYWYRLAE
jgi:uncharacterized protein (DUF2147 family)